ncbi:hypothetical protein [Actinoplanes sp. CA-252034]|uniref:hypothetical protein n=1 Tax=Actinoplanes sp. CA-252034 TaxID=3239906 RepID=UPI003D9742CB
MSCRRHGGKTTIALWMLVAAADVAIIVASTGLVALMLVLTILAVTVTAGVFAARSLGRRDPEPVKAVMRRRA